jgi:hypothetical protein
VRVACAQEALLEAGEVGVHQGLQVRVEHCRRGRLELAVLRHDVGRARHGHTWALALGRIGHRVLVPGFRYAWSMQTAIASAPASSAASRARSTEAMSSGTSTEPSAFSRSLTSKRCLRSTTGLGRTRWARRARDIALGAADLDEVAKARGGEDGHARAPPLEDRIGAHGGAVDHAPDVRARDAEGLEAGEYGARLLLPPRGDLGDDDAPRGLVDCGEIGERAADVDADEEHGRHDSRRLYNRPGSRVSWHRITLMPTVLRIGPYRFFFYSGDREEPRHVREHATELRRAWDEYFTE